MSDYCPNCGHVHIPAPSCAVGPTTQDVDPRELDMPESWDVETEDGQ